MTSIGMSEFLNRTAEEPVLGVNNTADIVIARFNRAGVMAMDSFEMKNKGRGTVTVTLKKRGREYSIPAEVLSTLRVAATDRFKGTSAQRRIKPGSIVIEDNNGTTKQRIEDTNADGILWQVNGPAGPAYPVKVGTVNYNDGVFDWTFQIGVTLAVTMAYRHTNWTDFATPITFDLFKAGGCQHYVVKGDTARTDNVLKGMSFDEVEIGWHAKLKPLRNRKPLSAWKCITTVMMKRFHCLSSREKSQITPSTMRKG